MKLKIFAATVAALTCAATATAEPYNGVAFAGGSASDGASGYAGVIYALPGHQLGRGLALRGSVNAGTYSYEAGDVTIDGEFVGSEVALVYQLSGDWGWANVSAGPRLSKVELSPDDPANDRQGTRVDTGLQTDGAYWANRSWRLDWIASVALRDRSYLGRLRLGPVINHERGTRLGLEAGVQGDQRYRATSAGVFAATRLDRNLEGQISLGASDQEGRRAKVYATLGVTLLF